MQFFKILIFVSLMASFSMASTETFKTHKDEKYKYLLVAPEKWKSQAIKDAATSPIKLSLLSSNKQASLVVMVSDQDQKTAAADFLKSMESSRSLKNNLKDEESMISGEPLKKWNVSEAVQARYEIKGKGPNFPVIQKTLVLKNAKFVYAIVLAYPKSQELKLKVSLEAIQNSFKAL